MTPQNKPMNNYIFVWLLPFLLILLIVYDGILKTPLPSLSAKTLATTTTATTATTPAAPINDQPYTIVCLGGSATSGGAVGKDHAYPNVLQNLLSNNNYTKANVMNFGHGTTNTLYAALNFDAMVPPDATHVTWEFAINDEYPNMAYTHDEYIDQIGLFMDQIQQHPNNPIVIFVMLWNTPFAIPPVTDVLDQLQSVLQDQLVVNVNAYIIQYNEHALAASVVWDTHPIPLPLGKHKFVVDYSHPTVSVHKYIADNLYRIFSETKSNKPFPFRSKAMFGNRFRRPARTSSILFDSPKLDRPQNYHQQPLTMHGKADKRRSDRIFSSRLPTCNNSTGNSTGNSTEDRATAALLLNFELLASEQLSAVTFGAIKFRRPEYVKYEGCSLGYRCPLASGGHCINDLSKYTICPGLKDALPDATVAERKNNFLRVAHEQQEEVRDSNATLRGKGARDVVQRIALNRADWMFPTVDYHHYYTTWFVPEEPVVSSGRITACSMDPEVDAEIRWFSLLITQR